MTGRGVYLGLTLVRMPSRTVVQIPGGDLRLWRRIQAEARRRELLPWQLWNAIAREWIEREHVPPIETPPPPREDSAAA